MTENLYKADARSAFLEKLNTGDYQVTFTDSDSNYEGYETFHKIEQAQNAAKRWLVHDYHPI